MRRDGMKKEDENQVPEFSGAPDFLDGRRRVYDDVRRELDRDLDDDDDEEEEEEEEDNTASLIRGLAMKVSNGGGRQRLNGEDDRYWKSLLKRESSPSINYAEEEEDCGDDHGIVRRSSAPSSSSTSLKLSLDYQKVLEAWSDRGSLWADMNKAAAGYMGEVPELMEVGGDERRWSRIRRREASVLRYKEKRHSRFFSNKIRYQVRKLNADQRPRLKGRFVKRSLEKIFI